MANLNSEQLRRLARLGAMARLEQLQQEASAIRAEFPELFGRGGRRSGARRGRRRGNPQAAGGRRRRGMSAAARKAVSARMKKYWAARRKAKAGK